MTCKLKNVKEIYITIRDNDGLFTNRETHGDIPGYNFALIPTVLLGLVILILKIRNSKDWIKTSEKMK